MNNDRVVDQVEKGAGRVIIGSGSDTGLSAGNGKITGLNPNKYYRVEELDEKGDIIYNYFVTKTGTIGDLGKIGKSSQITGLTNNVTYRVKSAELFASGTSLNYYYQFSNTQTPQSVSVDNNGTITIYENRSDCYLNLASSGSNKYIDPTKNYEVMKKNIQNDWDDFRTSVYRKGNNPNISSFPEDVTDETEYVKFISGYKIGIYLFSPNPTSSLGYTGTITPSFLANTSIIKLPSIDTENEYVFVQYEPNNNDDIINFWVLKVIVKPAIGSGSLSITNPSLPSEVTYNLTPTTNPGNAIPSGNATTGWYISISRTAAANPTLTLTITATAGLSINNWNYAPAGVKTQVPGTTVVDANTVTLTVNTAAAPFDQKIDIPTTVEFLYNSVPFNSVPITIRITD